MAGLETMNNKIKISIFVLFIMFISVIYYGYNWLTSPLYIKDPFPKQMTIDEFSSQWKNTTTYEERMELLPTLFQVEYRQTSSYKSLLDKSLINGMTDVQVKQVLGNPHSTTYYDEAGDHYKYFNYKLMPIGDYNRFQRFINNNISTGTESYLTVRFTRNLNNEYHVNQLYSN